MATQIQTAVKRLGRLAQEWRKAAEDETDATAGKIRLGDARDVEVLADYLHDVKLKDARAQLEAMDTEPREAALGCIAKRLWPKLGFVPLHFPRPKGQD